MTSERSGIVRWFEKSTYKETVTHLSEVYRTPRIKIDFGVDFCSNGEDVKSSIKEVKHEMHR
jgi:hypothetical protein